MIESPQRTAGDFFLTIQKPPAVGAYLFPVAEIESQKDEWQVDAEPHEQQSDHRSKGDLKKKTNYKFLQLGKNF